jgi:outer membrane protein assembly factor BamB
MPSLHDKAILLAICLATLLGAEAAVPQWPQFRGPGGHGIAAGQSIPLDFAPDQKLQWKVPLPAGHSSPAIWGDRIFITGHEGPLLKMIALDRTRGTVLWERERRITRVATYAHVAGSPANPTPATDGNRVIFYFDDYGLVVMDMAGTLLWEKKFPPTGNAFSYGASPVLDDGRIYLNRDGSLDSSWLCLDASNGEEIWRAAHPDSIISYCTPYFIEQQGQRLVLAGGSGRLAAYDARSGQRVWQVQGLPGFICPSPVAAGDRIVFGGWTTAHVSGRSRIESAFFDDDSGVSPEAMKDPAAFIAQFDQNKDGRLSLEEFPDSRARDAFRFLDRNKNGTIELEEWAPGYSEEGGGGGRNVLLGIEPGGTGDITETHVRWQLTRGLPYVPSPLAYRGRVYLVATGGFVTCVDLRSGQPHFERERLGLGGEYYASPVAVGEHILICAQRGTVFLIKAQDQLEIIHQVGLGEPIFATPAVADNTLYLRSETHLWAFGD